MTVIWTSLLAVVTLAAAAARSTEGWREIRPIGIDLISFRVPAGVLVLQRIEFEHGEFDIRRVHGSRVLKIIGNGPAESRLGSSARPYCVNGIRGVTRIQQGKRTVFLQIPPDYMYTFLFEFREADATAQKIMGTFRVKGVTGKCTGSLSGRSQYGGRPQIGPR